MSDKARLEASSKRELDVGRIMLNYLYNNFQMVLILVRRLVERTSFSEIFCAFATTSLRFDVFDHRCCCHRHRNCYYRY